ncbi:acyltransferase family protein [Granulicella sp. 5B5]|uniref:acyltransferase family protein n=1 Tax=Granulicella sp. 5B5 TaxID=1617967 RepID=UPI0015F54FA3|nr:acyltransferase [Granulicella sp. 5B5]QMV18644.1 acyltransferase family protein [Granulicella sp. 5B5]
MSRADADTADQAVRRSSYIPGLDGIRAIAFLLVFWAHALPDVSYYIPATLGVTIFFFLSGYLITTLLRRELEGTGTIVLRDFYLRRVLRIFLPLYVVYALAAAYAHFVQHDSMGNLSGFFSMLFYYYNYAMALGVKAWVPLGMNVIWSLSVEEHFYILFPLLYLALVRSRLAKATQTRLLIGFCLLELAWRFFLVTTHHNQHLWTYYATDARLDSILWGSVLALTHNPVFSRSNGGTDRSILPIRHTTLAFAGCVLLLLATLVPRSFLYRESLRYTVQALALYGIFSFVIPNIQHPSVAWLEWKPLRYLGWISYVLYLSHDFILNVLTRIWPHRFALTGSLSFALAIAFATLLRYTLELPLQRLRGRLRHTPAEPRLPQQPSQIL